MKTLKILIIAVFAIGFFTACDNEVKDQGEKNNADAWYTITGEVIDTTDSYVYLKVKQESGWKSLDSAQITNNKFAINGHVDNISFGYLTSDAFKGGVPMFIENTEISLNINPDSVNKTVVNGSETQTAYDNAKGKLNTYDEIWQDFYYNTYRYMADDEKAKNEDYLNSIYDSAQLEKKTYLIDFLNAKTDNVATAQLLTEQEDALGFEELVKIYDKLSPSVLASGPGLQLSERVEIMKKTAEGMPLLDFIMNDTAGNPIKLSEATSGKYVLVDFWAAWCGPCRKENPNVVENYKKYHDQGFDVFGVSFDEKKENWLKAIEDDQLLWMQVSDLKGWKNAAGKLYGIRSIPQNILLSPEGIILAKNLRGDDLGKKLEEIFSAK